MSDAPLTETPVTVERQEQCELELSLMFQILAEEIRLEQRHSIFKENAVSLFLQVPVKVIV